MIGSEFDSRVSKEMLASFETSERGNTALGVFVQDQTTPTIYMRALIESEQFVLAADIVQGERFISTCHLRAIVHAQ